MRERLRQRTLARYPRELFEKQVVAGMSPETPTRVFYERGLGMLDAFLEIVPEAQTGCPVALNR